MKSTQKNNGITLIALVITIIVLLILAGISIAMLTGQNGLLTKASKAEKETDIVDTKEQIKLEIMGNFNEKTANYTNQDVINAVKKITGNPVDENAPTVKSKKGNTIDISDLWVADKIVRFSINGTPHEVENGTTWDEYLTKLNLDNDYLWLYEIKSDAIFHYTGDTGSQVQGSWLYDSAMNIIYKSYLIKGDEYSWAIGGNAANLRCFFCWFLLTAIHLLNTHYLYGSCIPCIL